jgi:phage protein D
VFNFADISFPDSTVQPVNRLIDLNLYQERGAHELIIAKFKDWDVPHESLKQGTPVELTLFGGSASRPFNGYVHHVKKHNTPGSKWIELGVIGASYHLKQQRQKIYREVTASDVVREIALSHGFAFDITDHPRVYDQISQAGLSDLELCKKLAKQCGYSFRVQNTEIYFNPVMKVFNESKSNALYFFMGDQANPSGSTLYSFTPVVGETLDQDGEHKAAVAISGVDKFTGQLIQVTNQKRPKASRVKYEAEFFDRFDAITVANDYEIAKHESVSADERVRFPYRAVAEVLGTPDLYPDAPVYLEGVGQDYSGFWTVLKTEHKITSDTLLNHKYTTILHLGTDSLGQDTSQPNSPAVGQPEPNRKRQIIPNVRQTNKRPVSKLKPGSLKKTQGPVGFGTVNNRARPMVAKKTIVASKWKNTTKSLKTVSTPRTSPSPVVLAHKRSISGR